MSHVTIAERVTSIVAEKLKVEASTIREDSRFSEDLGADSLDMVELVMAFEEEFGCEIPDKEAEKIRTIKDATEHLTALKGTSNHSSEKPL